MSWKDIMGIKKMLRYKLRQRDMRYLVNKKGGGEPDKFPIPKDPFHDIFVDVHDIDDDGRWARLVLFYHDGSIVEGWTWLWKTMTPVEIINSELLYDGRFNSPK